jgi:hypothetical protein
MWVWNQNFLITTISYDICYDLYVYMFRPLFGYIQAIKIKLFRYEIQWSGDNHPLD